MLNLRSLTVLVILLHQVCTDSSHQLQLRNPSGESTAQKQLRRLLSVSVSQDVKSTRTLNKDLGLEQKQDTVLRFVPHKSNNELFYGHSNANTSGHHGNVSILGDDYDYDGSDSEADVSVLKFVSVVLSH